MQHFDMTCCISSHVFKPAKCFVSFLFVSGGFLLFSLFDPEDGGDMFVRNVMLAPNYTAI
jgi:hypothetical protein